MSQIALALLQAPLFRQHVAPQGHPESPERLLAVEAGVSGALAQLPDVSLRPLSPRAATRAELERAHSAGHIDTLMAIQGRSGYLDGDTFYSSGSLQAALAAAGGAVDLTDQLLDRKAQLGLLLARPPGHHATFDTAMGFCLINNVAVAAAHALQRGVRRVLILDWDVHHGNGTQDIFYTTDQVLYFSVHQNPWYPGTGQAHEIGSGTGLGYNFNVPLSRGAGDNEYFALWQRALLPLIDQYKPELLLISAGYDAHARDPLGHMRISSEGFGQLAQAVAQRAAPLCPVGLVLEGGYDLTALEESMAQTTLGLAAGTRGTAAPALASPVTASQQHSAEIHAAIAAHTGHFQL
ncbi:MAG TPA: histone deacetylase [Polyangiaceae bacterium]|nr:histone deacetylase [Polyangiaceae bacterium]